MLHHMATTLVCYGGHFESKILRETPISRSQTPPIGEAWGGLNFYTIPFLELITLMAEVCQIVNSRPIAGIPLDTDFATPLTPSTLLTMKTRHATV
jgi:hypothetical protein